MGNVPVSCCRSKSPRLHRATNSYISSTSFCRHNDRNLVSVTVRRGQSGEADSEQSSLHILQHISEREPDESETDPSSNPLDRPIFASRSSHTKSLRSSGGPGRQTLSISSAHDESTNQSNLSSPSKDQASSPHLSSHDPGHPSHVSENLNRQIGDLNESFSDATKLQTSEVETDSLDPSKHKPTTTEYSSTTCPTYPSIDKTIPFDPLRPNFSLLRTSSCSRIHTDLSTISQPNLAQTIKCVSLAVFYHIKNRTSDNSVEIFDETIHPLKIPDACNMRKPGGDDFDDEDEDYVDESFLSEDRPPVSHGTPITDVEEEPDKRIIYSFVKSVFRGAQLTSEYAITTLVYLERLMTYAEIDLTPKTWRRMFLGAILLSSKVWEDQAVWNVDYAQILEEISVEDINELERHFLGLIQFNMNVPSSVYAKYYFHLRTLAVINGLSKGHTRLTLADARRLEVSLETQ